MTTGAGFAHTHVIAYLAQPKMQRGINSDGEIVVEGMADLRIVGMSKSCKTVNIIVDDLCKVAEAEPHNILEVVEIVEALN